MLLTIRKLPAPSSTSQQVDLSWGRIDLKLEQKLKREAGLLRTLRRSCVRASRSLSARQQVDLKRKFESHHKLLNESGQPVLQVCTGMYGRGEAALSYNTANGTAELNVGCTREHTAGKAV